MPVRIYALAKDLKIDSKELVDICAKVGITGKGSALASLDDDEVVKLKTYLSGGGKKAEKPTEAPSAPAAPPATPSVLAPSTAVPPATAGAGGRSTPLAGVKVGSAAHPVAPAVPVVPAGPVARQPSSAQPGSGTPGGTGAVRDAYTREDFVTPVSTGKIKVITSAKSKTATGDAKREPGAEGERAKQPQKSRAPVINLAKMPTAKQPAAPAAPTEPPPQKPDIRLPRDAIVSSRAGQRPPLEHLVKTEPPSSPKRPATPKAAPPQVAGQAPLSRTAGRKGKGDKVAGGEEEAPGLLGMASSRADRQKARKTRMQTRVGPGREEDEASSHRRGRSLSRKGTNTAAPRKETAVLQVPCSVRTFCEVAGVTVSQVLKAMMSLGTMGNINTQLDQDAAQVLANALNVHVEYEKPPTLEETMLMGFEAQVDDPASLVTRPPVITFLGHVDHGKTSLLDRIIGIDVAAKEAGGITQHIRAYQVEKGGRQISFVDTPGHEAFTEMRARGANVTDIAVLVIAADDGVMPQTEEAISHAKAAGVPIVVALNKTDLRGLDINRVMQQLATQNLLPSEWGGDTEVVKTSALTGDGLDELVETLFGIAELHELTANPQRAAAGTCLEAEQQGERGVVAKIIVQNGTLKVGDIIVCGAAHGRVKAMYDTLKTQQRVEAAGPSTPVNITGLDVAPAAGEKFYVLPDIGTAREIAAQRAAHQREQGLSAVTPKVSFEKFQELLAEGRLGKKAEVSLLNLIIRADVRGSLEAIQKELSKFKHPEVQVRVLQYSVGGITTADVALANASDAVIIGFNVIPDEAARQMAEANNVEIRRYDIIYKLTEDIKAILEGKLKPEERVVELGRALVKQTFTISRVGVVAGCYVAQGTINRGCRIRVNRDGRTIGDYSLESLRREKEDVKEVQRGMECGIRLAGFTDVKKDDILEAYRIEEVARTL